MSKAVRISRNVTSASLNELAVFQTAPEEFPTIPISLRDSLSMTIVPGSDSQPPFNPNGLEFTPLQYVVEPRPSTALRPLTFDVLDVMFLRRANGRSARALALLIDDPDKILEAEQNHYYDRMKRPRPRFQFLPHISLLEVARPHALSSIRRWGIENAPASVSLRPLQTKTYSAHGEFSSDPIPGAIVATRRTDMQKPVVRHLAQATLPNDIFAKMAAQRDGN